MQRLHRRTRDLDGDVRRGDRSVRADASARGMTREREPRPENVQPTLPTGQAPTRRAETPSVIATAHTLPSNPLDSSPSLDSAATMAAPSDPSTLPPLLIGDILGERYQLIEELGRGGEGVVFRALDLRADTVVALKLFQHGEGSEQRLARFRRELSMARKVTHPGVVRIHDLVEVPGRFALSMELVEGVPLDARLASGPALSVDELIALARDLSQALAAAHEAGVTHRDLKPANVLLRAGTGRAVITDFGVSRLHGVSEPSPSGPMIESEHIKLTQEGRLIGTPQYMAPEQLEGSADVGPPADVYAFGLLMLEAATGQRAHDGTTLFSLREQRRTTAAPSLATLRPDLPPRLTAAIDRALLHDVDARFSSGRELVEELDLRGVESRRADSVMTSLPPPTQAPQSRSYTPWIVAAVCVVGAAAWTLTKQRAPSPTAVTPPIAAPSAKVPWAVSYRPKNVHKLPSESRCSEFPTHTPDGRRIVYDATFGPDSFVMVRDLATGEAHAITHLRGWDFAPVTSPDGTAVAFLRAQGGKVGTYVVDIDGKSEPELIIKGSVRPRFSLDGHAIWAGDRAAPALYKRSDHSVERTLSVPPGYLVSSVMELADGRVVASLPKIRESAGGGLAAYDREDSMTWLFQGNLGSTLALTPDGTHAMATAGDDPMLELIAIPLQHGEPIAMKEAKVIPRTGMSIAPDSSSMVWSECGGVPSLAIVDSEGKLPDAHAGFADIDAAPIAGTHKLLTMEGQGSVAHAHVIDRDGVVPTVDVALGQSAVALSVSSDASTITGVLANKGVFLLTVGSTDAPRWLTHATTDGSPSFRIGGREVIFGRDLPEGDSQVLSVPVAGGPTKLLLPTEATMPVASPVDDRIVYLQGREVSACIPMLFDLKTGAKRALSKKLAPGNFSRPAFSPDGARVALTRGPNTIIEVDVASGTVLRELDTGDSSVFRLLYSGTDLLALRTRWMGDIWMADGPIASP